MDSKEWYRRATSAILHTDIDECKTLEREVPFRFGVPPVSVANWDALSWVKWLILFCPEHDSNVVTK